MQCSRRECFYIILQNGRCDGTSVARRRQRTSATRLVRPIIELYMARGCTGSSSAPSLSVRNRPRAVGHCQRILYIVLRLYRTFPAAAGMRCVHHAHSCIAQPSAMPLRSITGAASRALVYARRANAMQCSPRPPSQNSSRFCQTDQAFSRRDMKAPQRDHGRLCVRRRCTVCGLPVRVLAGEHT